MCDRTADILSLVSRVPAKNLYSNRFATDVSPSYSHFVEETCNLYLLLEETAASLEHLGKQIKNFSLFNNEN
jgi:syntaxin 5